MRRILRHASCLLFLAGPVHANGLLALVGGGYHGEWDAVGRLEFHGKAFCTGVLIEEDLVLTAAHCLYDRDTGARVAVEDMEFLAGWRNGRAAAYRRVRRAVANPDYDFDAPSNSDRVRYDVALLELQHPIRNTTIAPFKTDKDPEAGDRIGVVSYARDGADAPELQDSCNVLSRQEGVVVMTCTVDFGASGAPVFSFSSGEPRIVSLVSAKAESGETPVSIGVALADQIAAVRAELDREADSARLPGVKTVTEPGMTNSPAKTVRP